MACFPGEYLTAGPISSSPLGLNLDWVLAGALIEGSIPPSCQGRHAQSKDLFTLAEFWIVACMVSR